MLITLSPQISRSAPLSEIVARANVLLETILEDSSLNVKADWQVDFDANLSPQLCLTLEVIDEFSEISDPITHSLKLTLTEAQKLDDLEWRLRHEWSEILSEQSRIHRQRLRRLISQLEEDN